MKRKKAITSIVIILIVICCCSVIMRMPPQDISITAKTGGHKTDVSGTDNLFYLSPLPDNVYCSAVIHFVAVENNSGQLFTSRGTGQYVNMGCSRLKIERDFLSSGNFLRIHLSLEAAQSDLKLEDGSPFDITKYSLKPVMVITEKQ